MAMIRKRIHPSGARWQVRWKLDGNEVSETFSTPTAAKGFRGLVEGNRGQYPEGWIPHHGWAAVAPPEEVLTLRAWFPRAIAARPRSSAANKARCQRQFDIYVPASLADVPMADVTREMAGVWVTNLTTQPAPGERARHGGPQGTSRASLRRQRLAKPPTKAPHVASPKLAHNVFGTISSAFKQAVRDDLIRRNPFEGLGADLANQGTKEQIHLDEDEFELMFAALRPDFAELARFAFVSGMRFGEITSLQWRDLNYQTGTASVRRAWKRNADNVYYLGAPKGKSKAKRTIVIDPTMMATLRLRDPRRDGRLATPDDVESYVFLNQAGARVTQSVYAHAWRKAVKVAQSRGLTKRPRFHDLRHSHATMLLSNGVSIVTVSLRLGHSSVAVTGDTYGHQGTGDDAAILAIFAR